MVQLLALHIRRVVTIASGQKANAMLSETMDAMDATRGYTRMHLPSDLILTSYSPNLLTTFISLQIDPNSLAVHSKMSNFDSIPPSVTRVIATAITLAQSFLYYTNLFIHAPATISSVNMFLSILEMDFRVLTGMICVTGWVIRHLVTIPFNLTQPCQDIFWTTLLMVVTTAASYPDPSISMEHIFTFIASQIQYGLVYYLLNFYHRAPVRMAMEGDLPSMYVPLEFLEDWIVAPRGFERLGRVSLRLPVIFSIRLRHTGNS